MTTEAKDPLAGLDTIDWAALGHAYGSAADVPGLLRALCAADEEERLGALGKLYTNIFHQGSRYEATAHAVPFLARIAADTSLADRDAVLGLLAGLAIGYDEAHLPGGVDTAGWRSRVAEFVARDPAEVLAEFDRFVAEAPDEGERRAREWRRQMFDCAYEQRAAAAELAAYDAVRGEVPAVTALLADADPGVRAGAAYVLGWFPEEAAGTLPALLGLLERETDPGATATALVAVGLLGTPGDAALAARLRPRLAAGEAVVRWAAATALARLGHPARDAAAVLAELAAAQAEPPSSGATGVPFHEGDLRGYSAASLTLLADRHPDETLSAATDGLAAAASGPAVFPVAAAALRLAFGDERPTPLPPFAELTPGQRRLVGVLAELDEHTRSWVNFLEIVDAWGLPRQREALRAYAGLPPG
ncbi:HEAT repeat domain-containing protein [Streptomyces millisiae]|uniref:HEAT repeat domain-containing protein n=1 Tax=Streptomyces millisiae TaxID=3075542 RepID=A0ABU2LM98_9ACTN|nr:HEAT repeat domain-containing protein [Streptomyces sp. DSM 44918]MDT0318720.1 HEAT repeat domain-containing protein [Streptomyces sp. DSM 44918]